MAKKKPRKKLPKELAVINADNCTGCESCLEVCPVDCIFMNSIGHGVKGNQSWCEIDLERCVGCEVCVHIPQKKSNPYELLVCPWMRSKWYRPSRLPRSLRKWVGHQSTFMKIGIDL